jgi:hypothetical protein
MLTTNIPSYFFISHYIIFQGVCRKNEWINEGIGRWMDGWMVVWMGAGAAICTAVVVVWCNGTSTSWESVFKISCSWVDLLISYVLLFGIMYLEWGDFVMDPKRKSIKFCANQEKCNDEMRSWQWLNKRSRKKAWAVHRKSKLTETKTGETGGGQSQEYAHQLTSRGLFTNNSSWQTKQSILHTYIHT